MEKLTGSKKIKTAVFISGAGSNLKNLIRFSKVKNSPISLDLIISNTSKANGLKLANKFAIEKMIFNFKNLIDTEKNILILLKKKNTTDLPSRFYENFIQEFYKKI
tara:strand:- start:1280 stop:1597 length:318 start_codon:yes stop_codon:yes gene_type:complete